MAKVDVDELVERMVRLLREDVVPVVPLRGSISASGGELAFVEVEVVCVLMCFCS